MDASSSSLHFIHRQADRLAARSCTRTPPRVGLTLCTEGEAWVLLNYRRYRLTRGSIYIVSPLIALHVLSQSEDYAEVQLQDDIKHFLPFFNRVIDVIASLNLPNRPCTTLTPPQCRLFLHRRHHIGQLRRESRNAATEEQRGLLALMADNLLQTTLLEVLHVFCRQIQTDNDADTGGRLDTAVYRFLVLLNLHFRHERSVKAYAAQVGLSTGHFTARVKSQTGKTPSEWIVLFTMTLARNMLENTTMSIKEIASELNFPEQFTFRKYFKLHAGLSPKDYRLSRRKDA